MTRTVRVTIDAATMSPAQAITVAARASDSLVILSHRAFNEFVAELGSLNAAMRHLTRVAATTGRPIGVNAETGDITSSTAFIAPRSWTAERLRGWIAGHHEALESAFGPATIREVS